MGTNSFKLYKGLQNSRYRFLSIFYFLLRLPAYSLFAFLSVQGSSPVPLQTSLQPCQTDISLFLYCQTQTPWLQFAALQNVVLFFFSLNVFFL